MASHTSRIDEQVKFNSDRANVVIQKKKQDDERKRKQMYDDALVNPTNATSAPSLLSGAPAGLDSSDQSQGPQLPPEVAQHVTGPDATPQTQAAFTTGVQTGAKAVLTAQANRVQSGGANQVQSQAPAAGNGVTAPLIPSQSQLAAPVQNLFSGFGGKSPFARMLSGALQAAGGSPTGFPSQPAAAAQAPQAAQPPQAAQAQTAAQPVQTAQQTPQTAAQANPFPEQQSQAAQDARDQSVQQSAQTMATDPNAAQLAQRSAERQQMLSQYQQQLADLSNPKSPLTTLQKVQQAQGIRAKIAAIGADILGQVKVDPNAMGAFAMARGTGIGAGAKAYQETAQADQRNDLEQQQLSQQQIQQKAQLLQDNMKAWQTMMDRDDSDQDVNNKRYAQENTDAQDALEHGAKDYGTFTGDVQGALAKAIQSGQINPSNVHVYHVGDGQVRVVEALDHTVDADTANKTLAANGVDYKVPDGQSISKRSLYTRVQNEQNQQAQLHQELTKAQAESDIVKNREIEVNAAKEGQTSAKSQADVNTLAENAAQGTGLSLDQLDPKTRAAVSAKLSVTDPNLNQQSITLTAADRNKMELAQNVQHNLDVIGGIIQRRPDLVGALLGREANGKWVVGTNDPDLASLKVAYDNYGQAAVGIHGSRSVINKEDAVKALSNNMKNGQQAVLSGIQTARDSADIFAHPVPKSKDGSPYITLPAGNGQQASPFQWKRALVKTGGDKTAAAQYLLGLGYK